MRRIRTRKEGHRERRLLGGCAGRCGSCKIWRGLGRRAGSLCLSRVVLGSRREFAIILARLHVFLSAIFGDTGDTRLTRSIRRHRVDIVASVEF